MVQQDWSVLYMSDQIECKLWRHYYILLHRFYSNITQWNGSSHWNEPEGYDYDQPTEVSIEFEKKTCQLKGYGVTINCDVRREFFIRGYIVPGDGTMMIWEKIFPTHSSFYSANLNLKSSELNGNIQYIDRRSCFWKGVFSYRLTQCNNRYQTQKFDTC